MDLTRYRSLLIFGGTFDPPHCGHIQLPQRVAQHIGADAILYIPAAVSPFKVGSEQTPADHRVTMLRLAISAVPHAHVLTDEIDRAASGEPSYTVVTLERLQRRMHREATLRLLIGADQLRSFDRWRDWQRIVQIAEPVVMVRPPDTAETLLNALPSGFDREAWSARFVPTPQMNVSSTDIRARVSEGRSIEGMTPLAVSQYITQHNLYR